MFIDVVKINIKSGNGGDGCVAFHREKYVPKGGPDGGDGGKGGDVIFYADPSMRTLLDFKYQRKYFAEPGENGSSNNKMGKRGKDMVISVPPGTIIKTVDDENIVADLMDENQKVVVLKGGRGGRGNARFATATRQAPAFAQPGQKTRPYEVILELKMIADVGLVGFPNVGKSTLLSVVTSARPKIADYHFTTLSPNLGVATVDGYSFVIADIPGLIEHAHEGVGLGHDFLRHVERTRLLVHVLDASGIEGRDPVEDYHKIREELVQYSEYLSELPEIIAANKTDLPDAEAGLELLQEHLPDKEIFPISAATQKGVKELLRKIAKEIIKLPTAEPIVTESIILNARIDEDYEIEIDSEGVYVVWGTLIERLIDSVNLYDKDSMTHFHHMLESYGIIEQLRKAGAKDGDIIRLNDTEFEFAE